MGRLRILAEMPSRQSPRPPIPLSKERANLRRDRVGPICGEVYPERGGSVLPTPTTMTTTAAVGETERLRTVLEINASLISSTVRKRSVSPTAAVVVIVVGVGNTDPPRSG